MNRGIRSAATGTDARTEAPPTGRMPPASLWRRLMGMVYEAVVLFGVLVFFGYGFSALLQFRGEPGPLRWAFQAFLLVVLGVYFVWSWSRGRRTLPMKTVSLQLVDRLDRPVTHGRALARYLAAWSLLVVPMLAARELNGWLALLLPVPVLWALVDRDRRALYDLIAGTRLVVRHTPKR